MSHPRETAANIICVAHMEDGNVILQPLDDGSRRLMQLVLDEAPGSLVWHYAGCDFTGPAAEPKRLYFACGGEGQWITDRNMTSMVYVGATDICVVLPPIETDGDTAGRLRLLGFYSGVAVLAGSTADRMMLGPRVECKCCAGPLIKAIELEWRVCDGCVNLCAHDYVRGPGNYQGQLAQMEYCSLCGRVSPHWQPNADPFIDTLNTVTEGSINILFVQDSTGESDTVMISKE